MRRVRQQTTRRLAFIAPSSLSPPPSLPPHRFLPVPSAPPPSTPSTLPFRAEKPRGPRMRGTEAMEARARAKCVCVCVFFTRFHPFSFFLDAPFFPGRDHGGDVKGRKPYLSARARVSSRSYLSSPRPSPRHSSSGTFILFEAEGEETTSGEPPPLSGGKEGEKIHQERREKRLLASLMITRQKTRTFLLARHRKTQLSLVLFRKKKRKNLMDTAARYPCLPPPAALPPKTLVFRRAPELSRPVLILKPATVPRVSRNEMRPPRAPMMLSLSLSLTS